MPHDTQFEIPQTRSLGGRRAYKGFFGIDIHKIGLSPPDGGEVVLTREVFEAGNGVWILAYDPKVKRIVLIRQFLVGPFVIGAENFTPMVITGRKEQDESFLSAAKRELLEEAGVSHVRSITPGPAFMPSPGYSTEEVETFLAKVDLSSSHPDKAAALEEITPVVDLGQFGLHGEGEYIQAEAWTLQAAIDALDRGEITAGPAVVLLNWAARSITP